MDLINPIATVVGTLVGVGIGSMITWRVAVGQREYDAKIRREDRRYERLVTASLWLRQSILAAAELDQSRSWRATVDITSWGPKWRPFIDAVGQASAAASLIRDAVSEDLWRALDVARDALWASKRSDKELLQTYMEAAEALRKGVDEVARPLARP